MQITKEDRHGQQEKVDGISYVVTHQFDEFAQEHPAEKEAESDGLSVPLLRCLKEAIEKGAVPEERPLQYGCLMDGVGAPRLPSTTIVSQIAFLSSRGRPAGQGQLLTSKYAGPRTYS